MRYLVLIAAVALQMCLGATYSWSVFVQPLKQVTGLAQGPVQLPFTVFYFVFPATAVLAGHSAWAATSAVAVFALANAAGRIVWGFGMDRLAPARAIAANLGAQAAVLLASFWLRQDPALFLAFAFLAGFNYGGVLVIYAASAARVWGKDNVGPVYGFLFSANIPAALAPLLAGLWYDASASFALPLAGLAVVLIAVAIWIGRCGAALDLPRMPSGRGS